MSEYENHLVWRRAMKCYLLDMPWWMHTPTHNDCDYPHKTCTKLSQYRCGGIGISEASPHQKCYWHFRPLRRKGHSPLGHGHWLISRASLGGHTPMYVWAALIGLKGLLITIKRGHGVEREIEWTDEYDQYRLYKNSEISKNEKYCFLERPGMVVHVYNSSTVESEKQVPGASWPTCLPYLMSLGQWEWACVL